MYLVYVEVYGNQQIHSRFTKRLDADEAAKELCLVGFYAWSEKA